MLIVPGRTEFLGVVRDVARGLAHASGFPKVLGDEIGLAVDECVTNVIRHAYAGADARPVEVRLDRIGEDLSVEVLDRGRAIDPASIPSVDLPRYAAEGRRGGLGVHLMHRIMDEVVYSRRGACNVCRMLKRRARDGAP